MKLARVGRGLLKTVEALLIPIALFATGVWIERGVTKRQEDIAVTQLLNSFFDGTAQLVTARNVPNSDSVLIARTRSTINRLRELDRKVEIVNFLRYVSEAQPHIIHGDIFEQDSQSDPYFVDLSNIDLSNTKISIMETEHVRLWGANFTDATFYNFTCSECGLTGASFRNAEFSFAVLDGSDLTDADFRGANVKHVYFGNAILDRAKWTDGRLCKEGSIGECK